MKLNVSREVLLRPLQLAVGVVERRQTLPVLGNVLMSFGNGQLRITGTDLEVEIRGAAALPDGVIGDGAITIPARKLLDICRSLPEEASLSLTWDGEQKVKIQSGRSRFTLSTMPAEDFPETNPDQGLVRFRMEENVLKSLIDATSFAMAQQDVRYYLNGMLWEITADRLRAVATDGHRLALADATIAAPSEIQKVQAIIPRKGVNELGRLLGSDGEVDVIIGANHLSVEGADYRCTTKLVDGAYPDYERVIPRGGTRVLEGERELFRQAFARAAILSNEKFRGVRLDLDAGKLTVAANNPEQETAEEEVPVEYDGERLEVGFNVSYLLDVLNALRGARVRLVLSDPNSSVLLTDPAAEGALYVIMPMRL